MPLSGHLGYAPQRAGEPGDGPACRYMQANPAYGSRAFWGSGMIRLRPSAIIHHILGKLTAVCGVVRG